MTHYLNIQLSTQNSIYITLLLLSFGCFKPNMELGTLKNVLD